jgi:HEAT repeat protein
MLRSANRSAGNLRLEESDEQLRNWLAEIHGRTIVLDDVARLLTILNYNDPVVRVAAIQHLAKIGWNLTLNADLSDPERRDLISASELAIPSLIDKLEDTDPRVRSSAALALGSLTNAPDTIIPALIRSLDDQDEKVVLTAMHGLGNFENGLSKAIPVMERFSDSQDDEIREMATNAILRFRKSSQ